MPLDIRPVREVGAVFVHGLFSSPRTWSHFEALIAADRELAHIDTLPFGYVSPVASFSPLRRIPSFDDVADSLGGFLEVEGGGYERLVLVSHSQGDWWFSAIWPGCSMRAGELNSPGSAGS